MKRLFRYFLAVPVGLAAISAGLTVGSLATSGPASAASGGGTLNVANLTTAQLDPVLSPNGPGEEFLDPAYAYPFRETPSGKIVGDLATSWGYVGTGNTKFQFTIRSNAKFSDGTPVTAAAVANSINYAKANAGGIDMLYMPTWTSATATGPDTVLITLSAPNPEMTALLSQNYPMGAIVSAAGIAAGKGLSANTYGAGPYELDVAATVPNSTYTYVPNPNYWNPSARNYNKIVIHIISDPSSTLSAIESGQVSAAYGDPTTATAAKNAGVKVLAAPVNWLGLTFCSYANTPIGNIKVRQALNMAVDRPAITKALFTGSTGVPTQEIEVSGTPGYVASLANLYPYNLSAAKKLLAQAGYPHGFTFTTTVASPMPGASNMAEAIASSLAKIGVTMNIKSATATDFAADVGVSQAFVLGIAGNNIWTEAAEFFIPGAAADFSKTPFPGITSGFAAASTSSTPATADATLATAILKDALNVPVSFTADLYYYKGIKGVQVSSAQPLPDILTLKP
jgi:peptide/nickel transport system substrate-binding protein